MGKYIVVLAASLAATAVPAAPETYRLIHAIGNEENEIARDLTKAECERRRDEHKAVSSALGIGGTVTCLPEWVFED